MNSSARRRAQQLRRRRSRRSGPGGEDRALISLVICGVVFVLLVAVKLLFPEAVSGLTKSAGELLGRNADFKEAFAAVGRAVSGEQSFGSSLQDAYTAVFNPQRTPVRTETQAPQEQVSLDPGARLIRFTTPALPEMALPEPEEASPPTGDAPSEEEPGSRDTAATAALSYVYTMPALPENASLEQRNLGFDHRTPVLGALSSTFGWREHPVEGGNRFHYGVDLAAEEGTDILAFASGTVYATGESSTLGNYVMLQHQGGYITLYGHCREVTVTGGSVDMGDKIAEVGSTGLVTGPHLHFELHDGDLYLNPIYYVEVQ